MKALTLWQPWASLMSSGNKKFETRTWTTKHRGALAIQAAAMMPPGPLGASRLGKIFRTECAAAFNVELAELDHHIKQLPFGAVLCIVDLVAIIPTDEVADISERERVFGNYSEGRYAWFTELIEVFKEPVPAKGNRMLWEWDR